MAEAPINRVLREDLANGIRAARFRDLEIETGVLLVMGAVVISMRHVLEERVNTSPALVATSMAAGMLRSLGLGRADARRVAGDAAQYVFQP
jgi:hypothetical protein